MSRLLVLALDRLIYFLAVNWDILRCLNSQSHFIATNVHYCDDNIITDHDALVSVSRQHQHEIAPSRGYCVLFYIIPLKSAGEMEQLEKSIGQLRHSCVSQRRVVHSLRKTATLNRLSLNAYARGEWWAGAYDLTSIPSMESLSSPLGASIQHRRDVSDWRGHSGWV